MLWDHLAVWELGGQSCNFCETSAICGEQYALASMRHLLSQ
jgi:hypothetical protein